MNLSSLPFFLRCRANRDAGAIELPFALPQDPGSYTRWYPALVRTGSCDFSLSLTDTA